MIKFSDIKALESKGLITAEQATAITTEYKLSEKSPHSYLTWIISILGGILVLWGIILIISSNWEDIPRLVRMSSGILLLIIFWVTGLWLKLKTSYAKWGEVFCLLGAGMWVADLALGSQLYHTQHSASETWLAIWLGVGLIPFFLNSKILYLFSLIAGYTFILMVINDYNFNDFYNATNSLYPLLSILLGIIFYNYGRSFLKGYSKLSFIFGSGIPLVLGIVFCADDYLYPYESFPITPLIGMTLLSLCVYLVYKNKQQSFSPFLYSLGIFLWMPYIHDEYLNLIAMTIIAWALMYSGALSRIISMINMGAILIVILIIIFVIKIYVSYSVSGFILLGSGILFITLSLILEKQRRRLIQRIKNTTKSSTSMLS